MPFINEEDKKRYMDKYNKQYYSQNKEKLLKYRKSRRKKDYENLRGFLNKKRDAIRKERINLGQIYKPKNPYS